MEKEIDLKYEGHALSPQIKKLVLESETSGVGCYNIIAKWKDSDEEYLRVCYEPENNEITAIDFDGGPYLSCGSVIKKKYVVTGFKHNGKLEDIKILLTECNS